MTYLQAIILAIIEGITEFLPISSTAHMKFANPFLGLGDSPFTNMFEVVIQLAAILSVVVIYWKKFLDIKHYSFYIKLIIAVMPALVIGGLFKKYIDIALSNLLFISCVMIGGGIILLFIDKFFKHPSIHEEEKISNKSAFIIGCFQVLSIIFPGLSRSAATILGGMSQKLTRSIAAEFSFFLAVPTMFAASVKSFYDVYKHNPEVLVKENFSLLGVGAVVSFIVALLSVKFFIYYLQRNDFRLFGYYRIALGVLFLLVSLSLGIKIIQ
ncbi:MAG: undecaprenyl-diphosphate phosphatase [Bacteroidetes bacterium]|nr:undecaprenyl-diphosphate phosphatase [Bacteroidota bacterium]